MCFILAFDGGTWIGIHVVDTKEKGVYSGQVERISRIWDGYECLLNLVDNNFTSCTSSRDWVGSEIPRDDE